ncbi:MAG: serine/threonine-protein kinase [Bryobacteraceae bacterium]
MTDPPRLEPLVHAVNQSAHAALKAMAPGDTVGPYRLVRLIAHGGMGDVWLARRHDNVHQRNVAIKLIKHTLTDPEVVRRFLVERTVLGNLEHPNIARLLDGGVLENGRPYLVMEYVSGQSIDVYCCDNSIPLRERLILFQQVCAAVQQAHRSLVIHRDIKPGNVLVTKDGTPKLLDFGLAKLLRPELLGLTPINTLPSMRMMTPEFASPEQLRQGIVTTSTDLYSLGLLLYVMLTARLPYEVVDKGFGEIVMIVNDTEPTPPSKLREDGELVSPFAKDLEGDLDNIVLTALRKLPEARYQSPEHLADDIQRYLDGFPVHARPSTLGYRAHKFALRHRLATGLVACLVVVMLASAISLVSLARRWRAERNSAQQMATFLTGLFEGASPDSGRGPDVTARELLDEGAASIDRSLPQPSARKADMLAAIGTSYQTLGLSKQAQALFERTVTMRRELNGQSPELAREMVRLAESIRETDIARAEKLAADSLEMRKRLLAADHPDIADSLNTIGNLRQGRGDLDGAIEAHRQAVALRRASLAADDPLLAVSLSNLGNVLREKSDLAAAEPPLQEALEIRKKAFGPEHPRVASLLSMLALLYQSQHDWDKAIAHIEQALVIERKSTKGDHPWVARSLNNYGSILHDAKRYDEAERAYVEGLEMNRRLRGADALPVAFPLNNLASLYEETGRHAEAERTFRESLAIRKKHLGDRHPMVARSYNNLGRLMMTMKRPTEAAGYFEQSLEILRQAKGGNPSQLAANLFNLARARAASGKTAQADPVFREAIDLVQTAKVTNAVEVKAGYGVFLASTSRCAEAKTWLEQAIEGRKHEPKPDAAKIEELERSLSKCETVLARR